MKYLKLSEEESSQLRGFIQDLIDQRQDDEDEGGEQSEALAFLRSIDKRLSEDES